MNLHRLLLTVVFATLFGEAAAVPGTPITQADMPWTSPGPGVYYLSEDVQQSSGVAFDIQHDEVTILLNDHKLDWGITGDGRIIDTHDRDSITLRGPGRIIQGDADPVVGTTFNAYVGGTNITVDGGIEFVFKATPNVSSSRGFIRGSGGGSSVVRGCKFDVSGRGPMNLFQFMSEYKILSNTVLVHDWSHPDAHYYSRLFFQCRSSEFAYNTIDVGPVHATNVWFGWGREDYHIHHNSVRFSAWHGRIVLADQGTTNWIVEHNDITVTGNISGTVYVFMTRVPSGGTTAPSQGHVFRYNSVDMVDTLGQTIGFTFGDTNGVVDITLHHNVFRGKDRLVAFSGGDVTGADIYCNQFLHEYTGGNTMSLSGGSLTDVVWSSNLFQTQREDGFITRGTSTADWIMCDNQAFTSSAHMSSPFAGVVFTTEPVCGNIGTIDCWATAGPDGVPSTPPVRPQTPLNVTVE